MAPDTYSAYSSQIGSLVPKIFTENIRYVCYRISKMFLLAQDALKVSTGASNPFDVCTPNLAVEHQQ